MLEVVSGLPDFSKYVVVKGSEVTFDVNVVGSATLDVEIVGSVTLNVNITGSDVTLNVNIESVAAEVVFNVKISSSDVTLDVNIASSAVALDINVKSPVDTDGNLKTSIQSSVQIDVNIAASAVTLNVKITGSDVTLDVNIKSQAVTLDVNIKAQEVTLNVNVQGTASVSIDNATVYLNVKHEENYVQGLYLEDESPPPSYLTLSTQRGLMIYNTRGFVYRLKVWVKNTDTANSQTLTVHISIAPGMPPIRTLNVTVPAGHDDWISIVEPDAVIRSFWWNYESLFIWFDVNSNLQLGVGEKVRGFAKYADGWYHSSNVCSSISIYGKTSGSIPVSGTVNTIQIPNRAVSSVSSAIYNIPDEETRTLLEVEGCGRVEWLNLWTDWYDMYFDIYVDGERICLMPGYPNVSMRIGIYKPHYGDTGLGNRVVVTKYDTSADEYAVEITIPLEFKKRFKVTAKNRAGTTKQAAAAAVLNMLS